MIMTLPRFMRISRIMSGHDWNGGYSRSITMENITDGRTIYITEYDLTRLEKLLAEEILKATNNFKHLECLTKELMKAKVWIRKMYLQMS